MVINNLGNEYKRNFFVTFLAYMYKKYWFLRASYTFVVTLSGYFRFQPLLSYTRFISYFNDYKLYLMKKKNPNFETSLKYFYPCLADKTVFTPVEPIYFYQDSWAAGKVFNLKPKKHVDVGSSVATVGIISQFVPTIMVDIRPLPVKLDQLTFVKGSILHLPFANNSLESISSICVIEHIGLGRYGDKLDSFGSEKAIAELKRVVKKSGHIIISVPIDSSSKVYFNAHRAFTREHFLSLFDGFQLEEDKYIYEYDLCDKYDASRGFGTGLFVFRKK